MFPVDDPTSPPLIGPSTIVVVNDARHQLQPEFLQRTTPYFFTVDGITGQYKWAKVRLTMLPHARSRVPCPSHAGSRLGTWDHPAPLSFSAEWPTKEIMKIQEYVIPLV